MAREGLTAFQAVNLYFQQACRLAPVAHLAQQMIALEQHLVVALQCAEIARVHLR